MKKLLIKLKAVFVENTCLECGSTDEYTSKECYEDAGRVVEFEVKCTACQADKALWSYGSWDDPLFYLESPWRRFMYLFLGKL